MKKEFNLSDKICVDCGHKKDKHKKDKCWFIIKRVPGIESCDCKRFVKEVRK